MQKCIENIAFAGAGNIATHLATALKLQGYQISGIWSRQHAHAIELANSCNSKACRNIDDLGKGADLIIIAVTDNAVRTVARQIKSFKGILVHTAASVSIDVLGNNVRHYGVIYPLQTFSKGVPVAIEDVPFFIEASSDDVLKSIKDVALKLTPKVFEVSSHQRMLLHTAAIFTGNYTNLMYVIGSEILKNSGLSPEILHPLILETARKAVKGDPLEMQTGPARRKDTSTLEEHYDALASMPQYADLYLILANMISKKYK